MPRMKNASEPPKEKLTLHKFGFVSPPKTEGPKLVHRAAGGDGEEKSNDSVLKSPEAGSEEKNSLQRSQTRAEQVDVSVCESEDSKHSSQLGDDGGERSKRARKPSHKILMMLEIEDEKRVKPPTNSNCSSASSSPEKVIALHKTEKVKTYSKSLINKSLSEDRNQSQEEAVVQTCCACNTMITRYSKYCNQIYCHPCIYMYRKFIKEGQLPKCNDDCDGDDVTGCQSCRTRRVNETLPPERRVKASPSNMTTPVRSNHKQHTEAITVPGATPPARALTIPVQHNVYLEGKPIKLSTSPILTDEMRTKLLALKSQQSIVVSSSPSISTQKLQGVTGTPQTVYRLLTSQNQKIILARSPIKTNAGIIQLQLSSLQQTPQGQVSKVLTLPTSTLSGRVTPIRILQTKAEQKVPIDNELQAGPRIKHVSRSAQIAQGEPAMVGGNADLRLSALPVEEKSKIWTQQPESSDDEDDDKNDVMSKQSANDSIMDVDSDEEYTYKPVKVKPKKPKYMPKKMSGGGLGKRRPRCGTCEGCTAQNCQVCVFCKDMKKYGGIGKLKQCCIERRCVNKDGPKYEGKNMYDRDDDSVDSIPRKQRRIEQQPTIKEKRIGRPPKRYQPDTASSLGDESVADDLEISADDMDELIESNLTNKPLTELLRVSARQKAAASSVVPATPAAQAIESGPFGHPLVTADGTVITDQNPGFSLDENTHRLMADFIDTYDIDKVWLQGMAVVASQPQSVRVLCYLCGSAGHNELTYCSVCCEPYHNFCLGESERKRIPGANDWVCKKCKFCCVCGKLENLLSCDRCTRAYHAECLVEGYSHAPTSAGVWVCSNCVKCTSCGATTPGGPDDHWSSDYSLCANCEKLRLKGNFCPVCGLCYSDDDWECKMIGCSLCDSWTHASCENLPDDLYELIGYVGDDEAQYVCRRCNPISSNQTEKPDWLQTLESLRTKGFSIVVASLLDKKYCQSIADINQEELCEFYRAHSEELKSFVLRELAGDTTSSSQVKLNKTTEKADGIEVEIVREDEKSADQNNHATSTQATCKSENLEQSSAELNQSTVALDPNKDQQTKRKRGRPPKIRKVTTGESEMEVVDTPEVKEKPQLQSDTEEKVTKSTEDESSSQTRTSRRSTRVTKQPDQTSTPSRSESKHSKQEEATPATRSVKTKDSKAKVEEKEENKSSRKLRSAIANQEGEEKLAKGKANKKEKKNYTTPKKKDVTKDKEESEAEDTGTLVRRSTRHGLAHSTPKTDTKSKKEAEADLTSPTSAIKENKKKRKRSPSEQSRVEAESEAKEQKTEGRSMRSSKESESKKVDSTKPETKTENEVVTEEATNHNEEEAAVQKAELERRDSAELNNISLSDSLIQMNDPVDLATRFKDVEWMEPIISFESLVDGNHPVDLKSIQNRINSYKSVGEFIDDVVRVLQSGLTRNKFLGNKSHKHLLAAKKLFKQEVSELFPWYEVSKSAYWEHNLYTPKGMMDKACLPPTSEHTYALWLKKDTSFNESPVQPSPYKQTPVKLDIQPIVVSSSGISEQSHGLSLDHTLMNPAMSVTASIDMRSCQLCGGIGDDLPNECGRLIYAGADDWVHINCALWSAEVFEEIDGTLQKVHSAITRGKQLDCNRCLTRGATVGCCARNCIANYHFKCARLSGCVFQEDKQVFCSNCTDSVTGQVVPQDKFSVSRTVTVDFAHVKMKKSWQKGFKPDEITVIAGSMTIEDLGYVIPDSDYLNVLVPVDYCISRVYWSTRTPYQRCIYKCKVVKIDTKNLIREEDVIMPDVTICHDSTHPEFTPPEQLCYRFPQVFPPSVFGHILSKSEYPDLHALEQTESREGSDLANLVGIAGALNRAAHKSKWRRDRRALKHATVLYGSAEPDRSGNIDDDVAEILDLVEDDGLPDEELEEREVVILRDVDENVAAEVVEVINNMSQEEAESQGGVQAVMQSILSKQDNKDIIPPLTTSRSHSEVKVTPKPIIVITPHSEFTEPQDSCIKPAKQSDARPRSASAEESAARPSSNLSVESNQSSEQSSFKAYSSGSSANDESDEETIMDITEEQTTPKALLSPPKIVITDFSFDESTKDPENDPFYGVNSETNAVSANTKDKLKFLVRKRSEGSVDPDALLSSVVPEASVMVPRDHLNVAQSSDGRLEAANRCTESSVSVYSLLERVSELEPPAITAQKEEIETGEDNSSQFDTTGDLSQEDDIESCSKDFVQPRKRKYRGMSRKAKFSNDLVDMRSSKYSYSGSFIVTRERTPDNSDLEAEEAGSDEESEVERLVVPPCHNCYIRGKDLNSQLPTILSAKVVVDKLEDDSDNEEMDPADQSHLGDDLNMTFYGNTLPSNHMVREPTSPPRDISREVRKDMINYCEDSESSSSTDEEDLCRPRALRRREKVNYDEDKVSDDDDEEGDGAAPKRGPGRPPKFPKARPTSGKVVINKDGTIRSRSENIPSALQKTISDAIRKARDREKNVLQQASVNQAYAGAAGQCAQYSVYDNNKRVFANKTNALNKEQLLDYSTLPRLRTDVETELTGDNCQLMMTSRSMQTSQLPLPTVEEEVSAGATNKRASCETGSVKKSRNRTSSVILAFHIESDDGFVFKADNWNDAWRGITDAVKDLRISSGLPALSFSGVDGLQMFGFDHTSIAYFTEQLYGARYCHNYRFKFHKPPLFECEEHIVETESGSARSEPYKSRRQPDMFSFLDSKYRKRPPPPAFNNALNTDSELSQKSSRRATSMDLPMAMRFRHIKFNAKEATAVYSSGIHGRGLFCKRPIDSGEMVIEYAGEVIRQSLCDKREKYYDSKGIGCYMFRIDDYLVVDATMKGNAARFINHSCDPNCFSKVIDVNGEKHIVIFANRPIQVGEELTYDYKFPIEEVKISCSCGSRKCRGYLN